MVKIRLENDPIPVTVYSPRAGRHNVIQEMTKK